MPNNNSMPQNIILGLLPSGMRIKLQQANQTNKAILRDMFWVFSFLLVAKLIAAGKEILVAYRYGLSPVLDGYLWVFNLLQWPASVFFSVVSFVLIPYLVRLRSESLSQATELQKALVLPTLGLGASVSFVVAGGIYWLLSSELSGLQAAGKAAAITALPWLMPSTVLAFLAALYATKLMSERRHANTFLEAMPAIGIALCLLVWPRSDGQSLGVLPLAAGTLAGFLAQTLILGRLNTSRADVNVQTSLKPHLSALHSALGVMLLAQIVMTSAGLIDQFVAVRMGEGVLASYSYAQRVMALVLGLSATVIGRAMLPIFSGEAHPLRRIKLAKRWAWRFGWAGVVGSILIMVFAYPVVSMLFERGAFTEDNTRTVSLILVILGVQLPFYLASMVLVQWIGSLGRPQWLLLSASAGLLAKLVSALAFFEFGAVGLAWATVIMYVVTFLTVLVITNLN